MALAAGSRLGVYEIVAPIGSGGMGEVYRARDTKLGRSVALKILPDEVAADADRIARFEREAKLLASLNHPNIAALYGMEHTGARHLLAMELVEGETLADRLKRGALAIDEALLVALQIAEALEGAHEQGVVHRDLKPANVKITPDGKVKVLDFGLAKAMEKAPAGANAVNSPTLSMMATQAGIILGTAAYMSPEQAKGAPADQRSDIFSFGVVLYEMLAGRPPFSGDTAPELMASVLVRDADLSSLPPHLNPRLRELLKRCLEKQPKKRWQAIGDVRAELEQLRVAPLEGERADVVRAPLWKRVAALSVMIAIAAALAGLAAWRLKPAPAQPVVRFPIMLEQGDRAANRGRQRIALSPDGTRVAMVVSRGNTQAIAVRTLNEIDYHIVAGTTQTLTVSSPAFSPDNQWLVFWSDSALKKVAVTGGVPVTLCKSGQPFGLTWQDGWIVYSAVNATHAIYRVSENGGEPEALIQIDPPELAYGPSLIDGGAAVLYTLATSRDFVRWDQANVVVQRLGSTERTVVVRGGTDARYVPTGHLVYALMGSLMGQRFDEKTARIQGAPVPLIEGLAGPLGGPSVTGVAHYAFSPTGVLAYAPGRTSGAGDELTVVRASRDGTVEQLPLPPRAYSQPRLSPDGKQLALVVDERGGPQVWIFAMGSQGPARRLTFDGANTWPVWTRDGRFVTFQSDRSGSRGIYRQPADGSGAAEQLTKADAESAHVPESWAPDGRTLLYRVVAPGTQTLWTMSASGERTTQLFAPVADGRAQVTATFSPDGRWVAYGSNQLGSSAYFVFVEPFPRTGAKYQVTTTATSTPVWSADGRQIFFAFSDRVMAADISTAPEFRFGQPVAWKSEGSLASGASLRNFDVTPDGKRLLLLTPPPSPDGRAFDADQLYVVVNWFEELRAKLPTP